MTIRSSARGILSEESTNTREQIVEMLTKAYRMEVETVMSYLANSINPDGVRAQEIVESLGEDIDEDWVTPAGSATGSRSSMVSFPGRSISSQSRLTCNHPTIRPTSFM